MRITDSTAAVVAEAAAAAAKELKAGKYANAEDVLKRLHSAIQAHAHAVYSESPVNTGAAEEIEVGAGEVKVQHGWTDDAVAEAVDTLAGIETRLHDIVAAMPDGSV